MSHFSVVAILPVGMSPDDQASVEEHLNRVMLPYDENIAVEAYEEDCYCSQSMVNAWVSHKMVEAFPGGMNELRDTFVAIRDAITSKYTYLNPVTGKQEPVPQQYSPWPEEYQRHHPDWADLEVKANEQEAEINKAWMEHIAAFQDARAAFELQAETEGIRRPDPTCGIYDEDFLRFVREEREYGPGMLERTGPLRNVVIENADGSYTVTPDHGDSYSFRLGDRYEDGSGCGGTGKVMTTYNPHSKWDWWVIGGRWDGDLAGAEQLDDGQGGFNFGDEFHTVERNVVRLADSKPSGAPYAFLTPEGEWVAKGEMGWWGISHGDAEAEEWEDTWTKVRQEYGENFAVQLDCHI